MSEYIVIDSDGKEEVWNNAVNLCYEGVTTCQVKEDFHNRKIIVQASGKDARGLMMMVMAALKKITSDYRGVRYEIIIPCNCDECKKGGEHVTTHKYEKLLRLYNEKGKTTVSCDESDQSISIDSLLYNIGLVLPDNLKETGGRKELKKIKIFFASSKELMIERNEFEIFINRENKKLFNDGIFLHLERWEDFIDAMSQTRLQDEYNKTAKEADIFVSLFFTRVGKFTEEEFEVAHKQFKASGKPHVYTYFKKAKVDMDDIPYEDIMSKRNFKEKLKKLEHFPTSYIDATDLKFQFKNQLEKLLREGKL